MLAVRRAGEDGQGVRRGQGVRVAAPEGFRLRHHVAVDRARRVRQLHGAAGACRIPAAEVNTGIRAETMRDANGGGRTGTIPI